MEELKGKYLITTDDWFFAPDGRQYKAAFGEITILKDDDTLGIKTNIRSTNWYAKVGSKNNHVIIAGCQIHYAVKAKEINSGRVNDYAIIDGAEKEYTRPSNIYIAK